METPLVTIDFKDFILGESENKRVPNRGFSQQSYGLNLIAEKGALYFQPDATDRGSTTLVEDVIATCVDPNFLGNDAYLVDDGGNYYTLSGSTFTKKQTDTTNTYAIGNTDIIYFSGEIFATAATEAIKLTSNFAAIDATWWSVTRGHGALQTAYRHPLEVVEDTLYIGDKNYIHTWDGSTSVNQAMSLPSDVNVISLRKHPDGQHLIAFCGITANYSHTRPGGGKIYIIDTVNLEWIREIPIESQVEGSRNVGGVVYVTYGDKIGYFNGDGITHLRDLGNSGNTTYSHQITNAEDILVVRSGVDVLAYGDLGGEGKAWWRAYRTGAGGASAVTALGYKGNGTVLVGYLNSSDSDQKLKEITVNSSTGIYGIFCSNPLLAGQNIALRRIEIDHTQTPASGVNAFSVNILSTVGVSKYASGSISYTDNPQETTRVDLDALVDGFQLQLVPSNGAMGFYQIRIYGETIE